VYTWGAMRILWSIGREGRYSANDSGACFVDYVGFPEEVEIVEEGVGGCGVGKEDHIRSVYLVGGVVVSVVVAGFDDGDVGGVGGLGWDSSDPHLFAAVKEAVGVCPDALGGEEQTPGEGGSL